MTTTITLDTINTTLASLKIDARVSYSATMRDGLVLVSCDCDQIDDAAEAYDAQEPSDRAMGASMEALGLVMADSGADGTEGRSWSTWRGLVSYEIVSAEPNGHVGERILFSTRERAEEALERLAESLDCDESEVRIVERAETPDAGF